MAAVFGHGVIGGATIAHPVGVSVLIICVLAILKQRRERVVLPLIFFMIVIPGAQRLVIASIDFSFVRILVIVSLARMMMYGESRGFKRDKPDTTLFLWMVFGIISYGILKGGLSGIITRTGYMLETVGAYYIGRVYVRSHADIQRIITAFGVISIPILVFFLIERVSGKNMFYIFGGVPENTMIRKGRLRCQGPFSHPIMAGVFWATLLPWLGGFWYAKSIPRSRLFIYIFCIFIIVANTASSTPIMVILFTLLGISMFSIRHQMPLIRKLLLILMIILHLVMKAPIWHLISRIDLSGGSTGWHRFNLIEQSINHFNEWWLVGIEYTGHWAFGMEDITNQYLLEGVRGGIVGMILFVLFISRVYALLGQAQRQANSKSELWILWSSGVMLFTHTMSFLAVAYFGQTNTAFFLLTGASVSVAIATKQTYQQKKNDELIHSDCKL